MSRHPIFSARFLAIISVALFPGFIFAQERPGPNDRPGSIRAVTVYSDRALVSRVTTVITGARTGNVLFRDLPANMDQGSLNATARGADITGVALVPVVKNTRGQWKNHPLQRKLDELDGEIAAAGDRLKTQQAGLKTLENLTNLSSEQAGRQLRAGTVDTAAWGRTLDFVEARRERYFAKIRSARTEIKELKARRSVTSARFAQVKKSQKKAGVIARVGYANRKNARVTVTLQYMVRGVSWRGFYDLRGSSESDDFQLIAHANIRQSTGEDWRGVQVTLSSARPAVGTSPGILRPWRVSSANLSGNRNANARREDKAGAFGGEGVGATGSSAESSNSSTFAIKLPGYETILSNNAAHEITLKTSALKGQLSHIALPSISEFVFLRARLANSSGMPIFPGKINIFLDGNFIGKSPLGNGVAAGEEFDLFLGPDQRMRLKRTLLRGDVEGSGVFTKNVKVVNQWEIEIGNYTRKARTITVFDQYPVPADPNISTAFLGSSVPTKPNANGIMKWKLEIEPGQKRKMDFSYSMTFPTEMWQRLIRPPSPTVEADDEMYQEAPRRARKKQKYNLEQLLK